MPTASCPTGSYRQTRAGRAGARAAHAAVGARASAAHYCLAYLVMIMLGVTEVSNFVHRHDFEEIWTESGFAQVPDYSTVWLYFALLENHKNAFQEVAEWLIGRASQHDRRIGQFVWVDATKWQTNSRLEHCCQNHEACEALSKRNWEEHKIRPPARKPKRMPEERLQRQHEIESQREEIEAAVIPEELRFERMEFDSETDVAPEDDVEMAPVAPVGYDSDYQYFEINGHRYRTRDKTAGLRRFTRRSGRIEYWLGGYALAAVDMYTKQIIAIVCFPADEQEYDHYPELMRRVRRALGRYPLAVSADAFSSTGPFFRWNTMRGIATVVPFKAAGGREREDYRTDLCDEHGIPRCQHCGGEGDQDSPGLGLYFDRNSDARIRFRCKTPQPGEPGCLRNQSIACSENWRLLIPLSRKTELYYALRKRHLFFEGTFRHWRQLYGGQGKETMSRLARRGVQAQELRAQAALMMQWFRISLRHGWLARPDGGRWATINENMPIQLSGDQRMPDGTTLRGVGQDALNRVIAARRRRKIDVPYGAVAIRKGYARTPAVMAAGARAERPPRLPRGDDGRPPPELPRL